MVVFVLAFHDFSVYLLRTRGPFTGKRKGPGRLTSCLSRLSGGGVKGRWGAGQAQPNLIEKMVLSR